MKKLVLTLAVLTPLILPRHNASAAGPAGDYAAGTKSAQHSAQNSMQHSVQQSVAKETAAGLPGMETAQRLAEADRLMGQGELMRAGALLARAFERGGDRYATGKRLAAVRNRQGRHREAAQVYALLMREYPRDGELPLLHAEALARSGEPEKALQLLEPLARDARDARDPAPRVARGRIYFQQGRLLEAREEYDAAKRLGAGPELAPERKALDDAINFAHLKSLLAAGGYELAQPLLQSMSSSGAYAREARLLNCRTLLAQRRCDAALAQGGALRRDYPGDPEVTLLYAEALVDKGRGAEAEQVLEGIGGSAAGSVGEREALYYRARGNWVRLLGDLYHYSNGSANESGAGVSLSQRFPDSRAVLSLSETTRLRRTDPQAALDIYFPSREGKRLSGALYLSAAPGASVLPRYSAGGEVGWALPPVELFAGYSRLGFHHSAADLLSAAVLWYLPATPLSLMGKVYVTPQSGSALLVTTLGWEATHRLRAFLSAGAGNSSERRTAREDLRRYDTWSVRGGAEFRFTPRYSVGGEGSFESRRNLYDRTGGVLYLRYWWH